MREIGNYVLENLLRMMIYAKHKILDREKDLDYVRKFIKNGK